MSIPSWVFPGARCVCIDDNWDDILNCGVDGASPVVGQRYTVSGGHCLLGIGFLTIEEADVAPDLYAISAFRPLTQQERDQERFATMLTASALSQARGLEVVL